MRIASRGTHPSTARHRAIVIVTFLPMLVGFACDGDAPAELPAYARPEESSGFELIFNGTITDGFEERRVYLFGNVAAGQSLTSEAKDRLVEEGWEVREGFFPGLIRAERLPNCIFYEDFKLSTATYGELLTRQQPDAVERASEYGSVLQVRIQECDAWPGGTDSSTVWPTPQV